MVSRGKAATRKLIHAPILLKADAAEGGPGWRDAEIAQSLEVGRATLERVRRQFVEEGFQAALKRRARVNRIVNGTGHVLGERSSLMTARLSAAWIVSLWAVAASGAEPATFVRKPAVTRTAAGARIDFTVSRPTDVAVFIEDAKGRIVRHLAAGLLGPNPPAPLTAHALEQSILWDGQADLGKPAGEGPFVGRVALGLGAAFDRVLISDPYTLGAVRCLAVGPDGTLFVMLACGGTGPVWSGQQLAAFNRDGTYKGVVMPFPADLPLAAVKGFGAIELAGQPVPVVQHMAARSFYSSCVGRKAGMAVTPAGQVLTLLESGRIGAVDARGGCPWGEYEGPALLGDAPGQEFNRRSFICVSGDGTWAYLSGLSPSAKGKAQAAVYRVPLPARGPADVFFGQPAETGHDAAHLGGPPRGLAIDGKGHLLIADPANGRIVIVHERDGSFVKAVPVSVAAPEAVEGEPAQPPAGPVLDTLAADPKTGAVYASFVGRTGAVDVVKYDGADDPKARAHVTLPRSGNVDFPWTMVLDAGAKPPALWFGSDTGRLLRVTDRGDVFSEAKEIGNDAIGNASFVDVNVDRVRNEVYSRISLAPYVWFRYSEKTGEITKVAPSPYPNAAGSSIAAGPDGYLYSPAYRYHVLRFDRDGKPAPWAVGEDHYPAETILRGVTTPVKPMKQGIFVPVSMTYLTHTLGIRPDGHIFMLEAGLPSQRPPKMLHEYLPSGERVTKDPIIWKVSDTAVGPKFDLQGNMYIAEQIKPVDQPYPPEFADLVGPVTGEGGSLRGVKANIVSMYGSVVKFSPKGGMFHFGGQNPFTGEPKLDPSLKTVDALSCSHNTLGPVKVTGAEWIRMGISHVDLIPCNCENTRFDVDDFGRVFYPDLGRFRVVVLDTNGNEITRFGRYGNANTTDAIAFAWLIGVGVTDRYAYMGDTLNRRLLRARLTYAAEETCPVP